MIEVFDVAALTSRTRLGREADVWAQINVLTRGRLLALVPAG